MEFLKYVSMFFLARFATNIVKYLISSLLAAKDVPCVDIKRQNAADNEALNRAKNGRKPKETFTEHSKASIGIKFSNP